MNKIKCNCSKCIDKCCLHNGLLYLSLSEIERIASYTGMSNEHFCKKNMNLFIGMDVTVLITPCIFFDARLGKCNIEEAKPLFCILYPYYIDPLSLCTVLDFSICSCNIEIEGTNSRKNYYETSFEPCLNEIEQWLNEFFGCHEKPDSFKMNIRETLMHSLSQ